MKKSTSVLGFRQVDDFSRNSSNMTDMEAKFDRHRNLRAKACVITYFYSSISQSIDIASSNRKECGLAQRSVKLSD